MDILSTDVKKKKSVLQVEKLEYEFQEIHNFIDII